MEGRRKMLGILTGLMGGRAAEKMVFDDITSGAASDLREATRLARMMVCDWGMNEDLGPRSFGRNQELVFLGREVNRTEDYSERTAQRIDDEIDALLRKSYDRATEILTTHRETLDKIATLLLERETLDGREVEELIAHGRILTEEERAAQEGAGGGEAESGEAEKTEPKQEPAPGQAATQGTEVAPGPDPSSVPAV
jgi:cell division protease FtsH